MTNNEIEEFLSKYTEEVIEKAKYVCRKNKDIIPYTLDKGSAYNNLEYIDKNNDELGISWWTNGFFGGLLWQIYSYTKNDDFAEFAHKQEKKLDRCFKIFNGIHHDVGFMWLLTSAAHYKVNKNTRSRNRALHAGTILAGRFNPEGNFIRAWNNFESKFSGWAIIDSLMNISLLYWASRETKDPRFKGIADRHAMTLVKYFVKEDGSCHHIVAFNPQTGDVETTYGGQGYEQNSSWTRGQAWGVYGFTNTYINTKNPTFLTTACRVADYFVDQYETWGMIPIDFIQPADNSREDNSAACIAAGGLLSLAECTRGAASDKYRTAGLNILHRTCTERVNLDKDFDALVTQCAVDYHGDQSVSTLIYADYFLIEALLKIKKMHLNIW